MLLLLLLHGGCRCEQHYSLQDDRFNLLRAGQQQHVLQVGNKAL
jgi:hypothetical protein